MGNQSLVNQPVNHNSIRISEPGNIFEYQKYKFKPVQIKKYWVQYEMNQFGWRITRKKKQFHFPLARKMHCFKGVVNCLRALLIHVQIDQGRKDCMSEANKSEQNLAYSRAVYLAPPRAESQNRTYSKFYCCLRLWPTVLVGIWSGEARLQCNYSQWQAYLTSSLITIH